MNAAGKKAEYCTALLSVGDVLMKFHDYTGAEQYFQRAVSICRTLGFHRLLGVGLIYQGLLATHQNQLELACCYFEEGIRAVSAVGTQRQIIRGLCALGYARLRQGNFSDAVTHLLEAVLLARTIGLPRHLCELQRNLADTYLALNRLDEAWCALHEALAIARQLGAVPQKVKALSSAIAYFHSLGWNKQAATWAGFLINEIDIDEKLFQPVCIQLEATLGSEAYRRALEQGRSLTLDEVVSEVLRLLENPSSETN
jgi:tetratricopeptide (TPR) repeat protein